MAKTDVPAGYTYNPATRGAINTATGERISRRQVEKLRIAAESGTSGSFEAKAKKQRLMGPPIKLPRRLKVHYKPVNQPRRQLVGQTRYRVKTFPEVIAVIGALPRGAEVYIKLYGRPVGDEYQQSHRLRWVAISKIFRAEEVMLEYRVIAANRANYYDIRWYDIVIRAINP